MPHRYRVQFLDETDRWWRAAQRVLTHPERAEDVDVVTSIVPVRATDGRWEVTLQVALDADALESLPDGDRQRSNREVGALLVRGDAGKSREMLGVSQLRDDGAGDRPTVLHERTMSGLRPGEPLEFHTIACADEPEDTPHDLTRFVSRDGEALFRLDEPTISRAGDCTSIVDRLDTSPMAPGSYVYHVHWSPSPERPPQTQQVSFVVGRPDGAPEQRTAGAR